MLSAVFVLICGVPRSTRLFEIIHFLRHAKGPVTAQEIAEALEVTKRTIYRDMAALQAMRLPIDGEAGVGYLLRSGFDLPPLMFTQDEMEAIVVGLALLGRTGDQDLEHSARRAAEKIADVLPRDAHPVAPLKVSRWNTVPPMHVEPSILRRHIREESVLQITYCDVENRSTVRKIKPLTLIYYIDAVVLVAWCDLRQAFRHFRIDRIEQCTPTGKHFHEIGETLFRQWEEKADLL